MNTGPRRICGLKNKQCKLPNAISFGTIEMNSHTDTAVCSSNFVALDYTSKECDVTPYNSNDIERNVSIDTCATACDDSSGVTCITKTHQALYMGNRGLDHSLLHLNQLRAHEVEVQDNPYNPEQCHIDTGFENVIIPLFTQGTVVFANTRSPTEVELQSHHHITLTSSRIWDPHNVTFPIPTTVVEDGQLVVKACHSERHLSVVKSRGPTMISAAYSLLDDHSISSMHSEEFIEPGLRETSYNIASLSQR